MACVYWLLLTVVFWSLVVDHQASPPGYTDHCKCKYFHPQTLLCKANFIAKVKILKKMKLAEVGEFSSYYFIENGKRTYVRDKIYVQILRTYKRTSGQTKKKVKLLVFPLAQYGCHPDFTTNVGTTYVLGGTETDEGVKMIGCKDFYEKWQDLTPVQKKLLGNGKYVKNCRCEICYEAQVYYRSTYEGEELSDIVREVSCEKTKNKCIYDMNDERGKKPLKYVGYGHNFDWCFQGNAFCEYNNKRKECRWKFHKKANSKQCEDQLNR